MAMGKLVSVGIGIAACFGIYHVATGPSRVREAFEPRLMEFHGVDFPEGEGTVQGEERPYRTGKVFILRPGWGSDDNIGGAKPPIVDPAFYYVASALRASTPDEVDTLIVAEKGARVTQTRSKQWIFETKAKGVNISVYDMRKKILIGMDFVHADQDGSYAAPLGRYVGTMPSRP